MQPSSVLEGILAAVTSDPSTLSLVIHESPEALLAFDAQRLIIDANGPAERYLGYERGDLVGRSVDVLLPSRFQQANAPPPAVTSDVTTVEVPALRRDGVEIMTVWRFVGLEGAHASVFLVHLCERSQVLAALETSRYAAIFEHLPVPVALARVEDGATIAMNQAFADLFELRREDFVGRQSTQIGIATPEQRAEVAQILAEQGAVHELECERRTLHGKPLHVSLSVRRIQVGGVDHLLSTVRDLSFRKAQEAALAQARAVAAENRARADYAVRLSGIGFWYCDLPFEELRWDARVKEHFFLPPETRVTIDLFYELIVSDDRERTRVAIAESIRDGTVYDITYRTLDPSSGDVKWIRAMGGASYAADGTPIRFDGVTVDITSQKRDEERMTGIAARLAEADRVKDEFLAMLGHELRNPLSPITMAVELLKQRGFEAREISIIERQTRHLTRLVDDLMDVSRITRGKVVLEKQRCEVSELVAAAIETVRPAIDGAQHTVISNVAPQGLVVEVDRVRIVQVLTNLLTNAAKYTPERGRIAIDARRSGQEIVLSVEDTGEGIREDLLPHVFDMFVQSPQTLDRAQGGLGLGLAIVKNLVTMHGGRVSARTGGPSRGSTFTIELPAAAGEGA